MTSLKQFRLFESRIFHLHYEAKVQSFRSQNGFNMTSLKKPFAPFFQSHFLPAFRG